MGEKAVLVVEVYDIMMVGSMSGKYVVVKGTAWIENWLWFDWGDSSFIAMR